MPMPNEIFRQTMKEFSFDLGKIIAGMHGIFNVLTEKVLQLEADNALSDNEITDLKERVEKLEQLHPEA